MRLTTIVMFGAGYVLGSRAGRERYEQIASAARRLLDDLDGARAQSRFEHYASRLEGFTVRGHETDGVASAATRPRRATGT